jgi:outer membrane protein
MKKLLYTLAFSLIAGAAAYADSPQKVGFVDFNECIENSLYGKREKEGFETLQKHMHDAISQAEKQLGDVIQKLQDQDYLDTLTLAAEEELKAKFQQMNQELNAYQGEYYRAMQQANVKITQAIAMQIKKASKVVAEEKGVDTIFSKESAFFYTPEQDLTEDLITEMNREFEVAAKENTLPEPTLMIPNQQPMLNPQEAVPSNG